MGKGLKVKYDNLVDKHRDEKEFEIYVMKYLEDFNDKGLQKMFFNGNNKELSRAVRSTFVNIFISLGLFIKKEEEYEITDLGIEIFKYIKKRPGIWYEEILEATVGEAQCVDLSAKLLLWRLLKNNIIQENEMKLRFKDLEKELSVKFNLEFIKFADIQYNLYYDELLYKGASRITDKILHKIKKLINNPDISYEDVKEYCEFLPISWYRGIYDIVTNHEDLVNDIISGFEDNTFKQVMQSGQKWHIRTRELMQKAGLNCSDYMKDPVFSDIIIDKLNINLPGGTLHNPDMLVYEEEFGPKGCLLIDAKDQNSISSEIHKLAGYNLYVSDPRVDSYCIISLRGTLPAIAKTRVENNIDEFNRITIIEEKALEMVSEADCSLDDILDFIVPKNGFKYIYTKVVEKYLSNL